MWVKEKSYWIQGNDVTRTRHYLLQMRSIYFEESNQLPLAVVYSDRKFLTIKLKCLRRKCLNFFSIVFRKIEVFDQHNWHILFTFQFQVVDGITLSLQTTSEEYRRCKGLVDTLRSWPNWIKIRRVSLSWTLRSPNVRNRTLFQLIRCYRFDLHRNSRVSEIIRLVHSPNTSTSSHGNWCNKSYRQKFSLQEKRVFEIFSASAAKICVLALAIIRARWQLSQSAVFSIWS